MSAKRSRRATDSLGTVPISPGARWGASTQRTLEAFAVSGRRMPPAVISAIATIKAEAAVVNHELGVSGVDAEVAAAVHRVSRQIAEGEWASEFPLDMFQSGSGTSSNMNVNEVVAFLASESLGRAVHPNDHVNASQSSNDVFPSALHLAVLRELRVELVPALSEIERTLAAQATRFDSVVKTGRTHLQDAMPVTLGQELAGYAAAMRLGRDRLSDARHRLRELPLGGTAVGTGVNAPPEFAPRVLERLSVIEGEAFRVPTDRFEAQSGRDALLELSGVLRVIATSIHRMATDLRWMSSGPTAGLAEIDLPVIAPGSSIMPGKVNPVVPEVVSQVCAQVMGHDAAVAFAATQSNFQLNVMMPVIGVNLLDAIGLLTRGLRVLDHRCLSGLVVDVAELRRRAEQNPVLATVLAPRIGYQAAADVVAAARRDRSSVLDVVVASGLLPEPEARLLLDVERLARGHLAGTSE